MTCRGTCQSGKNCKRALQTGTEFCFQHDFDYIVIQSGSFLYHGQLDKPNDFLSSKPSYGWFALAPNDAKIYGYVEQFTTFYDIEILNMNSVRNLKKLQLNYKAYAEEEKINSSAFDDVYEIHGDLAVRNSEWRGDDRVRKSIVWGIENGTLPDVDGYGAFAMKIGSHVNSAEHHAEFMITNPWEVMKWSRYMDLDYDIVEIKRKKMALNAAQTVSNRKKGRRRHFGGGGGMGGGMAGGRGLF